MIIKGKEASTLYVRKVKTPPRNLEVIPHESLRGPHSDHPIHVTK